MEITKNIKTDLVYQDASQFFELGGSITMKLSPRAAIEVCEQAAERGFFVGRIEGGIWHNPGFEARLDCIWDSKFNPPLSRMGAESSNHQAAIFIDERSQFHDVFIVSTWPFDKPIVVKNK